MRAQQCAQQRTGHGVGRVGHDAERPAWQSQGRRIDLQHAHVCARESRPQLLRATRMQFDSEDTRTGSEQVNSQSAVAGAHVEHELARL